MFASGRAFVPFVKDALLTELQAAALNSGVKPLKLLTGPAAPAHDANEVQSLSLISLAPIASRHWTKNTAENPPRATLLRMLTAVSFTPTSASRAIPVLREVPSSLDLIGIVLVSVGVYFATGAKLGQRV